MLYNKSYLLRLELFRFLFVFREKRTHGDTSLTRTKLKFTNSKFAIEGKKINLLQGGFVDILLNTYIYIYVYITKGVKIHIRVSTLQYVFLYLSILL